MDTEQLLPARLGGLGEPSQGLQAELWPRLQGRHQDQRGLDGVWQSRGVAGHQPPCGRLRGQHCVVPATPQSCLSSPSHKPGSPPGMSPARGLLGRALGRLGESGTPQGRPACASAAASPSPCGWRPETTAWTPHPLPLPPVPLPTHPQGNAGPKLSPRTPPPPSPVLPGGKGPGHSRALASGTHHVPVRAERLLVTASLRCRSLPPVETRAQVWPPTQVL